MCCTEEHCLFVSGCILGTGAHFGNILFCDFTGTWMSNQEMVYVLELLNDSKNTKSRQRHIFFFKVH